MPLRRPSLTIGLVAALLVGSVLAPSRCAREVVAEDEPVAKPPDVPLTVQVVDADTGGALEAEWTVHGHVRVAYSSVTLSVNAPSGYVLWDRPNYAAQVTRLATSALAVCPLHRELDLTVELRGPRGEMPRRAQLDSVELSGSGEQRSLASDQDPPGTFRVRGVAVLRGESLTLRGGGELGKKRGEEGFVWGLATFRIPVQGAPRLKVRLPLGPQAEPARIEPPKDHHQRLVETRIASTTLVRGRFRPNRKGAWEQQVARVGTGSLSVVALRSDGQPARHAWIEVRTPEGGTRVVETDEAGRASLDAPLGPLQVCLVEPGLVPAVQPTRATKAGDVVIEVREPLGVDLDVVVVTEDGHAVPYARIDVQQPSGEPWIDLEGGVQRIDEFTDQAGRRSLRRVEPGKVEVYASWCLKSGMAHVDLKDGKRSKVRIVVR